MRQAPITQLGFDGLLSEAAETNRKQGFARETAHLPATMDEALPIYREMIKLHDRAMRNADVREVRVIRDEARLLAAKLNGGERGILARDDAPGCQLVAVTAAKPDKVPLWGQSGSFVIAARAMKVRLKIEGLFGIGGSFYFWPGFAAHAVEPDKPFLSETGYRSFLGLTAAPIAGLRPDTFAAEMIGSYVMQELKGNLTAIAPKYRKPND